MKPKFTERQKEQLAEFHSTIVLNKYIQQVPTEKQAKFLLLSDMREGFFGGAARGGKVQPIDALILTPFGWRELGTIKPGMQITNPDGSIARVINTFPQGIIDSYELSFSDGAKCEAGLDHLWFISLSGKRQKADKEYIHNNQKVRGRIVTTEWLIRDCHTTRKRPYAPQIPLTKPIPFTLPHAHKVPLHPYVVGVLLGDGSLTACSCTLTCADSGIINRLRILGYTVNHINSRKGIDYTLPGIVPFLKKLKIMGHRAETKFIPSQYKYGSIDERMELICGLMDTDGYVDSRGHMSYTTISYRLALDFQEVIRSFGGVATLTSRIPSFTYNGEKRSGQRAYTIYFNTSMNAQLVGIDRKYKRAKKEFNAGRSELKRRVIKIKFKRKVEGVCIQVDHPNGLYITNDYIVTHNSSALLMAALQYVTESDYAALILRRTFRQLALKDAIMDRAERWLTQTDAKWEAQEKRWRFPSGATLTFGYLDTERDKYQYQSAAFQFIAFDELSQFLQSQYTYLFTRLTRLKSSSIPLRMRAASNPGDLGHLFVKARFITPTSAELKAKGKFFIPAYLEDNPYEDQEAYEQSLIELDPVTYAQMRHGNWDIEITGNFFKRESFEIIPSPPPALQVRYWDMAASVPKKGTEPDWTVGALMSVSHGIYSIKSIIRFQKTPAEAEKIIKQTAQIDGIETRIIMEQEPGASGLIAIDHYARDILQGYSFTGVKSTGSKVVRAQPFSAAVENGNVKICKDCQWIEDMLYELVAFPTKGIHDDIVDALSGAFTELNQGKTGKAVPASAMSVPGSAIPDLGGGGDIPEL